MAFMAAALPALSAIGTAVGAAGQLYQGFYQGAVADINSQIAQENADYVQMAGDEAATVASMKNAAELGRIKANQAASNIDVNSGSAKSVQLSHEVGGDVDVATILHNADLQSWGYTTQRDQFANEATASRVGGVLEATGDLLSNAKSFAPEAPGVNTGWADRRRGLGFVVT